MRFRRSTSATRSVLTLTAKQLSHFDQQGFLIVDNVLDSVLIGRLRDEYNALVDRVVNAREHRFDDRHTLTLEQKITHLIAVDPDAYEYLDISLPLREDLDDSAGMDAGDAVFALLTHPRILDIAESIVVSNPVQHVRIKPPEATRLRQRARTNIASAERDTVFNERWNRYRNDPLCA